MILTVQSCSTGRKKCPRIDLSTKNSTWTGDRTQFTALKIRRLSDGAMAWLKKVELSRINHFYFLSFLVLTSFPTHCRCRGSLLHLITLKHTHTHTHTHCRTPLDEGPARRRDICLSTHNTYRQTSMPSVRFETAITASKGPQTNALDLTAAGIG